MTKQDTRKQDKPSKSPVQQLNGRACCILDLPCCIPPPGMSTEQARVQMLAELCQKNCTGLSEVDAHKIASSLLEHFDLVPAGVGQAITNGYGRWMNKSVSNTEKESGKEVPRNAVLSGVDIVLNRDEDDEYDGRVL